MARQLRKMTEIAIIGCYFEVHDSRPVVWTCAAISIEGVNLVDR